MNDNKRPGDSTGKIENRKVRLESAGLESHRILIQQLRVASILGVYLVLLLIGFNLPASAGSARGSGAAYSGNASRDNSGNSAVSSDSSDSADGSTQNTITILGAGDNIIHQKLYENAETSDGYDFSSLYAKVKDYVQDADIATLNQEGPFATSIADPSGYPDFNTPSEDADALKDAGFDILNLANNHITDMGDSGVTATRDYLSSINLPYVGVGSAESADNIRVLEKNGIRVAFLGFTETENNPLPSGSANTIASLNDTSAVKSSIESAKNEADLVVVHAHWGNEDDAELTDTETEMAQEMVDWGADIIFGTHSHVLQKLDVLTRSSDGTKCPVMYSFGNFVSGQKVRNQLISGMLILTAEKDSSTGIVSIASMEFIPIVTHYENDRENVVIYPLSEYSDRLARENGVKTFDGEALTIQYINQIIENEIPARYLNQAGTLVSS